jgi:hypothetical protein
VASKYWRLQWFLLWLCDSGKSVFIYAYHNMKSSLCDESEADFFSLFGEIQLVHKTLSFRWM